MFTTIQTISGIVDYQPVHDIIEFTGHGDKVDQIKGLINNPEQIREGIRNKVFDHVKHAYGGDINDDLTIKQNQTNEIETIDDIESAVKEFDAFLESHDQEQVKTASMSNREKKQMIEGKYVPQIEETEQEIDVGYDQNFVELIQMAHARAVRERNKLFPVF